MSTRHFQAAYAIGLLVVGNLMDRFGTRKGFSLAIIFCRSRPWATLRAFGVWLWHGAVCSGSGRSGKLSCFNQEIANVSQKRARARDWHL